MILTVAELKKRVRCDTATDDQIADSLEAIEAVIRRYTNNNFQKRSIRFLGRSEGFRVYGSPQYFTVGDTVQLSYPEFNDGLYTVKVVEDTFLELDRPLMTAEENMVTKVSYPADVVQCAIDLFSWKLTRGSKVGIKSETLSRHSVTYEDSGTLFMGYPTGILNGLSLHKKARC